MLANLKISRKLAGAFAAIVAITFLAYGMLWSSLSNASDAGREQANNFMASLQGEKMRASLYRQQNAIGNNLLTGEDRFLKTYAEAKAGFGKAADEFKRLSGSEEQKERIDAARTVVESWWVSAGDKMVELGKNPATRGDALALPKKFPLTKAYDLLDEVAKVQGDLIGDNTVIVGSAHRKSLLTMLVSLVISGACAALMWFLLSRSIARPTRHLTEAMRRLATGDNAAEVPDTQRRDEIGAMAKAVQVFKDAAIEKNRLEAEAVTVRAAQTEQRDRQAAIDDAKAEDLKVFVHAVEAGFDNLSAGDLTVRMTESVAPEFEPIRAKFNDAVAQLEATIGSVVGAVGTMGVGLNEITVAAGDLSQRTEQQAASLEETVAALSEVVRGVNQTAQGAEDARAAAALAQMEAEKGGGVVSQAVTAMAEIERSSEKIGRIIGVIDEIAFQTNLLALNAGVEAARAGEAGRGFAVVAQEVRGLAQRSAEAAKEIKDLIHTSSAQVASGVEFVSASGRSLEQIVAQVGGVTTMISQMAQAAREQSVALKEVSVAADHMDKVTQQNAAMVEETTAAAQSLLGETKQLGGLVDGFRTASTQAGAPPPAKRATPRPASGPARAVMQMRSVGAGGAAPKSAPAKDEWAEF